MHLEQSRPLLFNVSLHNFRFNSVPFGFQDCGVLQVNGHPPMKVMLPSHVMQKHCSIASTLSPLHLITLANSFPHTHSPLSLAWNQGLEHRLFLLVRRTYPSDLHRAQTMEAAKKTIPQAILAVESKEYKPGTTKIADLLLL